MGFLGIKRKPREEKIDEPVVRTTAPLPPVLNVLVPDIAGATSFHLRQFYDIDEARAYIQALPSTSGLHAFWGLHNPPDGHVTGEGTGESMVLIRSTEGSDTVYVVSFVDLDSANAFARFESKRGMSLGLLLIYWAEIVDIVVDEFSVTITPEVAPRPGNRTAQAAPKPEPVAEKPAAEAPRPEPVAAAPVVEAPAPEPVVVEPVVQAPAPEPVAAEGAVTTPEPEPIAAEPVVQITAPEPPAAQPVVEAPEPVAALEPPVEAPPEPVVAGPVAQEPEPEPLAAAPAVEEPVAPPKPLFGTSAPEPAEPVPAINVAELAPVAEPEPVAEEAPEPAPLAETPTEVEFKPEPVAATGTDISTVSAPSVEAEPEAPLSGPEPEVVTRVEAVEAAELEPVAQPEPIAEAEPEPVRGPRFQPEPVAEPESDVHEPELTVSPIAEAESETVFETAGTEPALEEQAPEPVSQPAPAFTQLEPEPVTQETAQVEEPEPEPVAEEPKPLFEREPEAAAPGQFQVRLKIPGTEGGPVVEDEVTPEPEPVAFDEPEPIAETPPPLFRAGYPGGATEEEMDIEREAAAFLKASVNGKRSTLEDETQQAPEPETVQAEAVDAAVEPVAAVNGAWADTAAGTTIADDVTFEDYDEPVEGEAPEDLVHEVEKILKVKRWDKKNSPFRGFDSPPGRF